MPLLLSALLLSACSTTKVPSVASDSHKVAEPVLQLPDYLATDCRDVWHIEAASAMSNPLYWLRAIDCADRLSPADARAEAHGWPVESWSRAFKQGILLANGNVTPPERRDFVNALDSYSTEFPSQVRPLIQLWRSQQAAQLDLSETRTRAFKLQQGSDGQLEQLQQQLSQSRQAQAETQRKLQRLADIERQLSSRKSPDASDSTHAAHEEP